MMRQLFIGWPRTAAIAVLTVPAARPFNAAMRRGSLEETRWLRLLSIPQHRHATPMKAGPMTLSTSIDPPHDRSRPAAKIESMPAAIRRSRFSPKISHASSVVNTPSRFSRSDAVDDAVF